MMFRNRPVRMNASCKRQRPRAISAMSPRPRAIPRPRPRATPSTESFVLLTSNVMSPMLSRAHASSTETSMRAPCCHRRMMRRRIVFQSGVWPAARRKNAWKFRAPGSKMRGSWSSGVTQTMAAMMDPTELPAMTRGSKCVSCSAFTTPKWYRPGGGRADRNGTLGFQPH